MAGVQGQPTPWWQLPGQNGGGPAALKNLTENAPSGYTYDPVKMEYVHSPTQQGQAVNEFTTAANPALAGLFAGFGSTPSGSPTTTGASAFGATGSAAAPGGAAPAGSMSSVGGGHELTLPDQTAGTDAAYATAKDKVGLSGRASLDALRGELGATGNLGSGAEVQGVRDIVQSGAGELGQVARDQAATGAGLSADFAKTRYAGGITQRGQDVQAAEAQARLAQEGRLADSQLQFQKAQAASTNQLAMLQLALSGLKGSSGSGLVY